MKRPSACLARVADQGAYRGGVCTLPKGHGGPHGAISWAATPTISTKTELADRVKRVAGEMRTYADAKAASGNPAIAGQVREWADDLDGA